MKWIDFYLLTKLGISIKPSLLVYRLQYIDQRIVQRIHGRLNFSFPREVYVGRGRRFYSTSIVGSSGSSLPFYLCKGKLHPWYVTGFCDGESSFMILVQKRGEKWVTVARFAICLHEKDKVLLERIQSNFGGVGGFCKGNKGALTYVVSSFKDIRDVIIPHFDKYPLLTKKRADFELFKSAVKLMHKKEHLTSEGLVKIVSIKVSLNNGLTPALVEAFPTITPIDRPLVEGMEIPDPNWVVGFTDGEGCFKIKTYKSSAYNLGMQVGFTFQLTQHIRDIILMKSLISYLGSGSIEKPTELD